VTCAIFIQFPFHFQHIALNNDTMMMLIWRLIHSNIHHTNTIYKFIASVTYALKKVNHLRWNLESKYSFIKLVLEVN
jgi:hypothetical protein